MLLSLWRKNGYSIGKKKQFRGKKNDDLWKRYLLIHRKHSVRFQWVKGHNKHPQNERCDRLATIAANEKNMKIDHYFENSIKGISKSQKPLEIKNKSLKKYN